MKVEIKVQIKTEKIDVELTQEEAKDLYDQLGEFFEAATVIKWVPEPIPYFPPLPWKIGDRTGDPPWKELYPIITYSCGCSK